MNTYARIRKIEEPDAFKRFFNTLMGAMYKEDFEPTKEWHDYGLDGYVKSKKIAYAVYCPKYPERKSQEQYKDKIKSNIARLTEALKDGDISFKIDEWCFVTPDDLSVGLKNLIKELTNNEGWLWSTLTAQKLAPFFMSHEEIHQDFPEITAGIQYDKVPSVYVKFISNKGCKALEIFNNGTEAIQDLEIETSQDKKTWQSRNEHFLYDFDNPFDGYTHTCFTLKQGERQYVSNVPGSGDFYYKISGVGVESGKTFNQDGHIERMKDS